MVRIPKNIDVTVEPKSTAMKVGQPSERFYRNEVSKHLQEDQSDLYNALTWRMYHRIRESRRKSDTEIVTSTRTNDSNDGLSNSTGQVASTSVSKMKHQFACLPMLVRGSSSSLRDSLSNGKESSRSIRLSAHDRSIDDEGVFALDLEE